MTNPDMVLGQIHAKMAKLSVKISIVKVKVYNLTNPTIYDKLVLFLENYETKGYIKWITYATVHTLKVKNICWSNTIIFT